MDKRSLLYKEKRDIFMSRNIKEGVDSFMFMIGSGFFCFCFLIAIGYFLYKYFSYFGVNILSVTFLIIMTILFFAIFSSILPKFWNNGSNTLEQFMLEYK